MKQIYNRKTKVGKCEVSTVQYDESIGWQRDAETMIFDEEGRDVYMEGHGYDLNKEGLDREHKRIVQALRDKKLTLEK